MELDPGTPGRCPGQKAGTKRLSHPGIPEVNELKENPTFQIRLSATEEDKAGSMLVEGWGGELPPKPLCGRTLSRVTGSMEMWGDQTPALGRRDQRKSKKT